MFGKKLCRQIISAANQSYCLKKLLRWVNLSADELYMWGLWAQSLEPPRAEVQFVALPILNHDQLIGQTVSTSQCEKTDVIKLYSKVSTLLSFMGWLQNCELFTLLHTLREALSRVWLSFSWVCHGSDNGLFIGRIISSFYDADADADANAECWCWGADELILILTVILSWPLFKCSFKL